MADFPSRLDTLRFPSSDYPMAAPNNAQQRRELALVSESEYLACMHARYTMRYDNVDA